MITPQKWSQLRKDMQSLGVDEADLDERFILGSGAGGQKINKSNTCVMLKHVPTGVVVKCQHTRSREDNRFHARRRLCDKLKEQRDDVLSKRQQAAAKIARQKRRRSRRAKQNMLDDKRHASKTKQLRTKPKES